MRSIINAVVFALVTVMVVNVWGNFVMESKVGEFTPPNRNIFAQRMFEGVDTGVNTQTTDCWTLPEEKWGDLEINCALFLEAYYTKDDQLFERRSNQLAKEFRNPIRFVYPVNVTADRLVRYIDLDMQMHGKLNCALIKKGCTNTEPMERAEKSKVLALKDKILRFMLMSTFFGVLLPAVAMLYAWFEYHAKSVVHSKREHYEAPTLMQSLKFANEERVMANAALYGGLINTFAWVAIAIVLS